MNASSSLKILASSSPPPPLISSTSIRPIGKASPNPRFLPKLSKPIRCMRDSNNLNFGSKSNSQTHDFPVSFASSIGAPPLQETTTSADKLRLLVSEFRSLPEPIDRVKRLLNYASALSPLDDSARVPSNKVPGCSTQVWLEIKIDDFGRVRFRADSDSEISKGFCSCLIWILDGAKPEEVMGVKGEDLTDMNVGVHGKVQSRVNTWHNVLMTMQKRTLALVDVAHRDGDRPPPSSQQQHHQHDLLLGYVNRSYMESSKLSDYSLSLLPLYYDFTI